MVQFKEKQYTNAVGNLVVFTDVCIDSECGNGDFSLGHIDATHWPTHSVYTLTIYPHRAGNEQAILKGFRSMDAAKEEACEILKEYNQEK